MNRNDLEQFIAQNGKEIYSFCCWLTRNRQEADDLFQDTFVKALEKDSLPSGQGEIKKLLLTTSVRIWKDKTRKYARRRRIAEANDLTEIIDLAQTTDSTFEQPEEYVLKQEKLNILRTCIEKLPEKKRLMVLLCYAENLSMEEIAAVMKLPEGTVKSTLFRIKKSLAAQISEYE